MSFPFKIKKEKIEENFNGSILFLIANLFIKNLLYFSYIWQHRSRNPTPYIRLQCLTLRAYNNFVGILLRWLKCPAEICTNNTPSNVGLNLTLQIWEKIRACEASLYTNNLSCYIIEAINCLVIIFYTQPYVITMFTQLIFPRHYCK